MAKKKTRTRGSSETRDLQDSAQRIWLAGLGAMSVAEEEGGKLFRSLVDRGRSFEESLIAPLRSAPNKVRGSVKQARQRAGKAVERLEGALDSQFTAALHKVGVPTREEISRLTHRVEELTESLDRARRSRKKKSAPGKKTAKKTAKKPARKTARTRSAGTAKKTTKKRRVSSARSS